MKNAKFVLIIFLFIFSAESCKKDKRDWLFPINPHDFLSSSKYEKLTVDVVYVEGNQPTTEAMNHVKDFLSERLNKPGGITITYKSISPSGKTSFTIDDLREIEKKHRSSYSKHKSLVAFVFFADAPYSDGNVLGIAYGNSSVGIFEKTIHDHSGGLGQSPRSILESTVVEHEFAHLFGLVDNGTEMANAHSSNGKHCNNQNCLMYYATETTDIMASIIGGSVPALDDNCIADLRKNGGK